MCKCMQFISTAGEREREGGGGKEIERGGGGGEGGAVFYNLYIKISILDKLSGTGRMNTPVLDQSLKLSNFGSSQYLDG